MRYIILILAIFYLCSNQISAQDLNGVYTTNYTVFKNPNDESKNLAFTCNDFIFFDINEFPDLKGSITISGKDDNDETVNMKFIVYGDKKVDYNGGFTQISYNSRLSILNVEIENQTYLLNYSFNNKEKYFTVTFPGGAYQVWFIKGKL